jgi:hypothetical protein
VCYGVQRGASKNKVLGPKRLGSSRALAFPNPWIVAHQPLL